VLPPQGKQAPKRRIMKAIISTLVAAWAVFSTLAVTVQAAPVGSQSWWDEMDREGRGGRGN